MERSLLEQNSVELGHAADTQPITNADTAVSAPPVERSPEVPTQESVFAPNDATEYRRKWEMIQTEFVDDPRGSVRKADQLVDTTVKRLVEVFAEQRSRLEDEWDHNENVSTEDLRQAFRKYRAFFDRLLSM